VVSLVHANCIYLTFLLRTKQGLAHNIAALFAYSFWILTVPWQPAIGVASFTAAVTLRSLLAEMRKSPEPPPDPEMPAPPKPRPPVKLPPPKPPTPAELMLRESRLVKDREPAETFTTYFRPPPFAGVDLDKLKSESDE